MGKEANVPRGTIRVWHELGFMHVCMFGNGDERGGRGALARVLASGTQRTR